MIQNERVKTLNSEATRSGSYVLYWMHASQRTEYNHALEYAILKANELGKPLIVYFGIFEGFPEANERHYYFMLEGLREVQSSLEKRRIIMVVQMGSPDLGAIEISNDACLAVTDKGYLNLDRKWTARAREKIKCPLIEVETNVVVPVQEASSKEEYAAATIRPKLGKKLRHYLVPVQQHRPDRSSLSLDFDSIDLKDIEEVISSSRIDRTVKNVSHFRGGTSEAKRHLNDFLRNKLKHYEKLRNDPTRDFVSNLSPYLHFGQISPIYVALKVAETTARGKISYLEELVVRRELSMNFAHYNPYYDSIEGLPTWAKITLQEHSQDTREYVYKIDELENAKTHDPYWNAAQKEMMIKGKMHGYMRMYWGKKILEWTETPSEAFRIASHLNDKYELDGRDANGHTGVAWCFGKHDRPWQERKVFGNIRYMNANGLRRKFDVDLYVRLISDADRNSSS